MSATTTQARDVRYVKRGRFRLAEPVPDHIKAAADAYANLPLVAFEKSLPGDSPVSLRSLLHAMSYTLASLDYKRRHDPDMPVSEAVMPWVASYAAQAKSLLWATKDGPELTADLPVPPLLVVTPDDCRARYLALYNDCELSSALDPARRDLVSPERRKELSDLAFKLYEDLINAGVVVSEGGAA